MSKKTNKIIEKLIAPAGIAINGDNPWDIQVRDDRFYGRVLAQGSLGLGESYMAGWWNCERLDVLFEKILRAGLADKLPSLARLWLTLKSKISNRQSRSRAFAVGERHYDLGNDLFELMLDERMVYSCAYWKTASDLTAAQQAKLDLICRKLYLQPGMRVLDVGCGWGSWAKFAAERYGVEVVGITVSREQAEHAKRQVGGLPVEIRLQDYREVDERFDRVMSLAMFEAVGYKNYHTFMNVAERCLEPDGLFLLHTFGNTRPTFASDPWFDKYIFPNGMIPSVEQIGKAARHLFVMEDWHNFGADYDQTLMAWYKNFNNNWEQLKDRYSESFKRMWNYYLLSLAGAFRARHIQLWQIIFSKNGLLGGYESLR